MSQKPTLSAFIEIRHPSHGNLTHQLGANPFQLGRMRGDAILDDVEVSASHCQILWLNDCFHVFDLNSSNGTFLNGQRIAKSKLKDGDLIKLGRVEIRFHINSDATSAKHSGRHSISALLKSFNAPQLSDSNELEILKLVENAQRSLYENTVLILDVVYPNRTAEKIQVFERNCILGRVATVGRFDQDEEISRRHTSIQLELDGSILVSDLGSTNGTFVNDIRITNPTHVKPGDVVRLGHTSLKTSFKTIGGKGL